MDSSRVILTFDTIHGKKTNQSSTFRAPFHFTGPFEPHSVRSIELGANVALYGNVLKNVKGVNVREYIHMRDGIYTFALPIQWLSIHADLIKT
jgi:hypothetical protein